ncbi:Calcitonin gene-related peptide type 1 like protein [Argiope bruennichi]|uniref:Calcitonin gene-related peptide type 1 like protein n=1 Tax=Argiope bruennichi TaxID=94029 RepID=A0A8T0G0C0_ARGBR|nr:Calcitonin gene-related peptide type 1 like protein [Argiope bruennichi]
MKRKQSLLLKIRIKICYKKIFLRKAVRATLVLVPLFGLHFCIIIYRPPQSTRCDLLTAYTYFSHAMDGLQGLLVSLIFCYMNGEVIYLQKRTYQRYRLRHGIGRGRTQSSVMMHPVSVTQVSSMIETQTSQVGLHYRTRNGDRPRDLGNSVVEGNAVVEDVAVV